MAPDILSSKTLSGSNHAHDDREYTLLNIGHGLSGHSESIGVI